MLLPSAHACRNASTQLPPKPIPHPASCRNHAPLPAATKALVHDLDLQIRAAGLSGIPLLGNGGSVSDPNTPDRCACRRRRYPCPYTEVSPLRWLPSLTPCPGATSLEALGVGTPGRPALASPVSWHPKVPGARRPACLQGEQRGAGGAGQPACWGGGHQRARRLHLRRVGAAHLRPRGQRQLHVSEGHASPLVPRMVPGSAGSAPGSMRSTGAIPGTWGWGWDGAEHSGSRRDTRQLHQAHARVQHPCAPAAPLQRDAGEARPGRQLRGVHYRGCQ